MRVNKMQILFSGLFLVGNIQPAQSAEILARQNQNAEMVVSVYNNLGLVHDTRKVNLREGRSEVAFEGVAGSIQPESAILSGQGIRVWEQNYDYNILTPENLMNSYVGKEVKTAIQNPQNGQTMFNKAILLSNNYGNPVLHFDYGVEANFPGRLIYEELPPNLRTKPTLVISLENQNAGEKNLELTYLTGGLSWKADYVAQIMSENELNLNTWITLKNESGTDYADAKIQLISGNVNHSAGSGSVIRPLMMAKSVRMENTAMDSVASNISPENVSDYYMYVLPRKTTLKNKQSKQISLMNINKVKYEKEYRLSSPLYLGIGASQSEFEKRHPQIIFKLTNEKSANLGQPLPAGKVRFYENKNGENMVFLGEDSISQTAIGEKVELNIGQAFDIFVAGKIVDAKAISKDIYEYRVEISFQNVSKQTAAISFEQNIYNNWEILSENLQSEKKNSSVAVWKFNLKPKETTKLNFSVRVNRNI